MVPGSSRRLAHPHRRSAWASTRMPRQPAPPHSGLPGRPARAVSRTSCSWPATPEHSRLRSSIASMSCASSCPGALCSARCYGTRNLVATIAGAMRPEARLRILTSVLPWVLANVGSDLGTTDLAAMAEALEDAGLLVTIQRPVTPADSWVDAFVVGEAPRCARPPSGPAPEGTSSQSAGSACRRSATRAGRASL